MPTPADLKAHLSADPRSVGYAAPLAAKKDAEVARLGNLQQYEGRKPRVPLRDIFLYIDSQPGLWLRIVDHAASGGQTAGVMAARQSVEFRDRPQYADVKVDDPAFVGALDAMIADAFGFTATHKAAVLALGAATLSDFEMAFGAGVTIHHLEIAAARRA